MPDDSDVIINATRMPRAADAPLPWEGPSVAGAIPPERLRSSRLLEVAGALADFARPYADGAVVAMAPQAQVADVDGRTLVVVCPTSSRRARLRNGLIEAAYSYDVGVLRLLRDGDRPEVIAATVEELASALLAAGVLPCDAEITSVGDELLDASQLRRRTMFTAVLSVEVDDCVLSEPTERLG